MSPHDPNRVTKDLQALLVKLRFDKVMSGRDHQDDPIIIGKPPDSGTSEKRITPVPTQLSNEDGLLGDDITDHPDRINILDLHPLRQESPTGGLKDNRGKPRIDLLPSQVLLTIAEAFGYGAEKYHPHNWRLGISWSQTYGSLMRHLLAWNDGEEIDEESGLHHLALAGGQLMFLLEYYLTETGQDDRFSTVSKTTTAGYRDKDQNEGDTIRTMDSDVETKTS